MPKDAAHLKQHRFEVDGIEPLGKDPICVRLYADDDLKVRAMSDRSQFIRDAVSTALESI